MLGVIIHSLALLALPATVLGQAGLAFDGPSRSAAADKTYALEVTVDGSGTVTNNPDLWVRGVTEIGSRVEINSVPVGLVVSMFTHKVTLVEGPNTISVISIDTLGNINIVLSI